MDDKIKRDIWGVVCFALVAITLLLVIGWVMSPTHITIDFKMDNHTLEAFKLAYNCSGGYGG